MEFELHMVGMADSEALRDFADGHLKSLMHRFERPRYSGGRIQLRIRPVAFRSTGLATRFEVEVLISLPHTRTVVIRKASPIAQKGLSEALEAAEATVRRMSEKKASGRKTVGRHKARQVRDLKRGQPA